MSLSTLLDFVLHIDKHLQTFTATYDSWVYLLLFAIIFVETGLVIMPFLPGDSLLFAAGSLAALGSLDLGWLLVLLIVAAIVGDSVNYALGHQLGVRAFSGRYRWLNPAHLARTEAFFAKHGGKAIVSISISLWQDTANGRKLSGSKGRSTPNAGFNSPSWPGKSPSPSNWAGAIRV
jgi:membrane-associated protein